MKFAIEKTISYCHKDRVRICKRKESYFKDLSNNNSLYDVQYMLVILIKTTEDFKLEETFNIVSNTDSIQYRPKGIFKNSKGYYYKDSNKKVKYLTQEESDQLLVYCTSSLKYINEL